MNNFISPVLAPSKNDFRRQLDVYRKTAPFKQEYVGMRNPYDGTVICDSVDYDRYLREKLFHDLCEKAAEEELHRRSLVLESNSAKKTKRSFWSMVFVCLLFFALILPASINTAKDTGYQLGHADGVVSGYEQGHTAGYKEGSSTVSRSSSSSSGGSSSGGSINRNYSSVNLNRLPDDQSDSVYITATGSKYHRSNCSYLANSRRETTLNAAKSAGYGPCSRCKPPQ